MGFFKHNLTGTEWLNTLQRLKLLEEKVFKKTKRLLATKAQKILILKHTGLLDKIGELKLTTTQRALLVSLLIDADTDNVEKDLNVVFTKDSELENLQNYTFLVNFFEKIGLQKQTKEADKIFQKIQTKKDLSGK